MISIFIITKTKKKLINEQIEEKCKENKISIIFLYLFTYNFQNNFVFNCLKSKQNKKKHKN